MYGDGLVSCHMTNHDGIATFIVVRHRVDGQRAHVIAERVSTISGRSEGCGQVSFVEPCDLGCHDDWVGTLDCYSDDDFTSHQANNYRTDGGDNGNS